jgi:hypothetical protein
MDWRWAVCILLALRVLVVRGALTDADVLSTIQTVFPPSDGSTLQSAGGGGLAQVQTVLDRFPTVGCPAFTTSAAWPAVAGSTEQDLFHACALAVLGSFANNEVTNGGACGSFSLETRTGAIIPGAQDEERQQSLAILSSLIVVLLIAVGSVMFYARGSSVL